MVGLFWLFLHTDYGLKLSAVGMNDKFAKSQGISTSKYTGIGLFIAGFMFSFAGGIMVQTQQFIDVSMGIGIVIHGLAALMVGESIIGNNTRLKQIMAPIIGAIFYQQIQSFVLFCGLAPSDLKLFTGFVVLLVLFFSKKKSQRSSN